MTYFDDKSEVIKIELTNHGKKLLSKGAFKPTYYAFFDDEVIYDAEYIGIFETQNSTQDRILNETPSSKPQSNFLNIEKEVLENLNSIFESDIYVLPHINDADSSVEMPLGVSSFNSNFYPAWNCIPLIGAVSSINNYVFSSFSQPYLKIPQINMQNIPFNVYGATDIDDSPPEYELNNFIESINPGYYMYTKLNENIFKILELNVDDKKENFDIELFIEEKNDASSYWKKLYFIEKKKNILNNILLDEDPEDVQIEQLTSEYAEYYINLKVDNEIETIPEVQENIPDIYSTNINQGVFGEDC